MDVENKQTLPNLVWYEQLREDHPGDQLAEAILASVDSYRIILLALEGRALEFRDRARAERSIERKAIVKRHQAINGSLSKVVTSKRILYVRARLEGLELTWKQVVYPRARSRHAEKKRWLKDVGAMRKSGVDMRHVVSGAHPEEVALLKRHEREARVIRGLWKQAKKAEGQLATLGRRVQKLLDATAGNDA